jgi:hypothetical protein
MTLLPMPRSLSEDAHAPHKEIGESDRAGHQPHGPEETGLDVGQRQALRVHAEHAGDQRRRQQQRGDDRERVEMPVALLFQLEMNFLL